MSNGITADVNALTKAGQQFNAVAAGLHTIAENLAGRLSGLGDFWGDDEYGQNFAKTYVTPADAWMNFAGVASNQGLPAIADTVDTWAQTYQDSMNREAANATSVYNGVTG